MRERFREVSCKKRQRSKRIEAGGFLKHISTLGTRVQSANFISFFSFVVERMISLSLSLFLDVGLRKLKGPLQLRALSANRNVQIT